METFYFEEVTDEDDDVVLHHDDINQIDKDNNVHSSEIECSVSNTICPVKEHHQKKDQIVFHVLHKELKSHPYFSGGGLTMTRVDNKVFFYGGCSKTGTTSAKLFYYNYDENEWYASPEEKSEDSGDKPSPRYGHSAISHQETIYIFGGQGESHNHSHQDVPSTSSLSCWNDVYSYNMKTKSWSEIEVSDDKEKNPSPRNSHSAIILDDPSTSENNAKMIIFGGANELNGPNNECWGFDLTTKAWEHLHCIGDDNGDVPDAREMHTACIVNYHQTVFPNEDVDSNKKKQHNLLVIEMIIMGGRKENGEICQDCWSLNLVTLRWRRLPPPPTPRCSHTAEFFPSNGNNKQCPTLCFFGGYDGDRTIFDSFLQYDITNQAWSCSANVDVPRRFAHVSCMNESCDKMLVFGGVNTEQELSSLMEVSLL